MSKLTPILFIFYFTNYSYLIKCEIYFNLPNVGTKVFIYKEFGKYPRHCGISTVLRTTNKRFIVIHLSSFDNV